MVNEVIVCFLSYFAFSTAKFPPQKIYRKKLNQNSKIYNFKTKTNGEMKVIYFFILFNLNNLLAPN